MQCILTKYEFRIRIRAGAIVENLSIFGRNEDEAQRKLRRMYPGCEVLECRSVTATLTAGRGIVVNYEDVVNLIVAG